MITIFFMDFGLCLHCRQIKAFKNLTIFISVSTCRLPKSVEIWVVSMASIEHGYYDKMVKNK